MAKLNSTTIQDITNKMSLGVLSTTNNKNYFEESFQWSSQLDSSDIFGETVPTASNSTEADANATNFAIITKLTDYQLDEIPASNGQGYSCYATPGNTSSVRLTHFLTPQKYGNGYAFILKDSAGTTIALTAGSYQMDYHNGIMRFNEGNTPSDEGWSTPLTVTVYRYTGSMLSNVISSNSISDSWRLPVRVLDESSTVLSGWSADPVIDGVTLVSDDIVLFSALTNALENNRKYVWDNVATSWTLVEDGQEEDGSPQDGDKLIVTEGDTSADKTFTFNGTAWVATSNSSLTVRESDGNPEGTNITDIVLCPGDSDNVFIDGTTAYLHAPDAPDTIDINNTITEYSGRISTSNINYKSGDPAGTSINYITRSTGIPTSNTFSSTATSFRSASVGILSVTLNGTVIANLDLAANFNESNRAGSQVMADYDVTGAGDAVTNGVVNFTGTASGYGNLTLNSVNWTQNIEADGYQKGSCTINVTDPALWRQGYNTIVVSRDGETSSTYELFYDTDAGANPSVTASNLTIDTPVVKSVSGISYYDTGSTFDYDLVVSNAFNNVYHASNAPVVLSGFPGVASANISYTDGSVTGVSTPPDISETMTITDYEFVVPAGQEENDVQVTATPRDPYGSYTADTSASSGISIMSVNAESTTTDEYFVDENYRFPRTSNFDTVPVSATGNWTGTTSLSTLANELQVYDEDSATKKCLAHPSVDYSSGRLPIGPDYSGLAAGTVYDYHRIFQGTIDNSNGIIDLPGITDADLSSGNVKIDIKVPTKTDWISLNSDYSLGSFTDNARFVDDVWTLNTDYSLDEWVVPTVANGYKYKVTVDAGSSAGTEPTWGTTVGGTTVDGGITWTCYEIDSEEGCRINPGSHSPSIDGSVEFTLGTYSSDTSVSRYLFIRITYASNSQSGALTEGFGISNW